MNIVDRWNSPIAWLTSDWTLKIQISILPQYLIGIDLSIDDLDPEFDDEPHKVIIDYDVPHDDKEELKEDLTHTPKMFDSYIDMEIGLLRGLDG